MLENCPNTKNIFVFGVNQEQKSALIFHPRCKLWSCDFCAELNKEYWIAQASRGAIIITSEGRELQFVTLTSRGYTTPNSSLWFFKQNWPKLSRRIKYHTAKDSEKSGAEWAYFLVPERHKSGIAHFHLLAATSIGSASLWKKHAFASGFGYIKDVQNDITPARVVDYVTKYLHKGMGAENWPTGFRRVRHSNNWPISHEKPLVGWDWKTYSQARTVWWEKMALLNMGYEVIDKTDQ